LAFGPGGVPLATTGHPQLRDANRDGFADLIGRFPLAEAEIADGVTEACLTGEINGVAFTACDAIRMVPR
jgi:hypothetical protein